jgi:hypothetical protein
VSIEATKWSSSEGEIPQKMINEINPLTRETYRIDPNLIDVDSKIVALIAQGDYRHRQIFELIQNAADAILEDPTLAGGGRVKIVLSQHGLYCANEGAPFSLEGFVALRYPIGSAKNGKQVNGNQIGRYGHGFKSVLAITKKPRIYSRSGSFFYCFENVLDYLSEDRGDGNPYLDVTRLGTVNNPKVSIFAVAKPVDPAADASEDSILEEMMEWATTVIFLPFEDEWYYTDKPPFDHLKQEMETFPSSFLVFTGHVRRLDLEIREIEKFDIRSFYCDIKSTREVLPEIRGDSEKFGTNKLQIRVCSVMQEGDARVSDWIVFSDENVQISDEIGKTGLQTNRRTDEDGNYLDVEVSWAVKLDLLSNKRGEFWFHFPTKDWTSLSGIINAPWDTNNERTKVFEDPFNEYLIERVSHLVHQSMPELINFLGDDLGKIFDLVPARQAEAEGIAKLLARRIPELAQIYATIPDLDGKLTLPSSLQRYPSKLLAMDLEFASELARDWAEMKVGPRNFPHWTCISSPNRSARLAIWFKAESESGTNHE